MTQDRGSSEWDAFYAEEPTVTSTLFNLSGHVPLFEAIEASSPSRALEVGVGSGTMSLFVGTRGVEVVGVDDDARIVERARDRARAVTTVSYVVGDAFRLTSLFPAGSFDVAFSQGFFEHFDDEQIRDLTRQQLTVARRVLFSVPSDQYPRQDFGNERLMSPAQWESVLGGVGQASARQPQASRP
jgi:SAM-dependent methyltransferase